MSTQPITIDGFLYAAPVPGARPDIAAFDLVSSPTDALADDVVTFCATTDPRIAAALLTEVQPGDLLRVSGIWMEAGFSGELAQLTVDTLDVLAAAPVREPQEMVLDRYGDYCVIFDADTDAVPVFTAQGQWVGLADTPDVITALIDIHERATGGDN